MFEPAFVLGQLIRGRSMPHKALINPAFPALLDKFDQFLEWVVGHIGQTDRKGVESKLKIVGKPACIEHRLFGIVPVFWAN